MTIRHLYPAVEPSLNLDFANSKKLDSRITFTRGSTATYTDESGIIRTAAANEARFDHDTDGNSLGLLIEESRTNYATNSTDLTGWVNSASAGNGVLPTAQIITNIAPDGSNSVTEITLERAIANTGNYSIYRDFFGTTNVCTASAYIKASRPQDVGKVINFYYNQGTISFVDVTLTSDWQRISSSGTGGSVGLPSFALYTSTASAGEVKLLAWGLQVEEASFPTSYIPTSGSTVTRSADVASMTGTNFSSWWNANESTYYADVFSFGAGQTNRAILGINGSDSERQVQFDLNSVNNVTQINTRVGDVFYTSIINGQCVGLRIKAVGSIAATQVALSVNGSNVVTSSPPRLASSIPTTMDIGRYLANSGFSLNGTISRIAYYPVRLPDATLQALTL